MIKGLEIDPCGSKLKPELSIFFHFDQWLLSTGPERKGEAPQGINPQLENGLLIVHAFEAMKRTDPLYKYGIVIEYNTNPVIKEKGNAIFVHLLRGPDKPTVGCVAIDEKTMKDLLGWLDPVKKPFILMGPADYLKTF